MILLQNAGIERTSVSHAALVVGVVPVLVALMAAGLGQGDTRPVTWGGYGLALAGVALVAGAGGAGASASGDLLVLASVTLSAGFIVLQPRLLAGRDPAAVTAVQFAAGALVAAPVAAVAEGAPSLPVQAAPALAAVALALAGTLLPFWLFAFGQARVPAELAGAFLNLEPVVGAAAGWLAFGEAAAVGQLAGAVVVLAGIALSALAPGRDDQRAGAARREPTESFEPRVGGCESAAATRHLDDRFHVSSGATRCRCPPPRRRRLPRRSRGGQPLAPAPA